MSKRVSFWVKLVLSGVLVAVILWKFPIAQILASFKSVQPGYFLLCFVFGELIIVSQAVRWRYLLVLEEGRGAPRFAELLSYTVAGYFFNVVAPGGMGGDAYRSLAFGRARNALASSVAAVSLARVLGLVALCALFWVGLGVYEGGALPAPALWFMGLASLALVAFFIFLLWNPFLKKTDKKSQNKWIQKAIHFIQKFKEYKKFPGRVCLAFLGSLWMQVLTIAMQWACFRALGIEVPVGLLLVAMPVTLLASSVPVSLNGIGVREWTLLSLTAGLVSPDTLLASLLLGYAMILLQAAQGFVVFQFVRRG